MEWRGDGVRSRESGVVPTINDENLTFYLVVCQADFKGFAILQNPVNWFFWV